MLNIIYKITGTFFLGLGILGILIPGLPSTVFFLITASLYLKSSEKLYNRLISNKYIGPYILNYRKTKGLTPKMKIYSIVFMWIMISCSVLFFIHKPVADYIVLTAGVVGTFVVGLLIPTIKPDK